MLRLSLKSQRGQAIPVALLVLVVVVLLGFSLYDFSQNDSLLLNRNEDAKQADYLARAGVDAAKDWWKKQDPKPTTTKAFDRIYLTKSGDYVLTDPGADKVGYTNVNISYTSGTNNKWTVSSTAVVNNAQKTVTADSTSLVTDTQLIALSPPWYRWDHATRPSEAYIQKGDNVQDVVLDGEHMNMYHHDAIAGVAIVGRNDGYFNDDPLKLIDDNDDCRIGYTASSLFFNSPLDLRLWGGLFKGARQGFLVASAETIVFNKPVSVRFGNYGGGALVLNVPDGFGIPGQEIVPRPLSTDWRDVFYNINFENKVDRNARYGRVYFTSIMVGGWSSTSSPSTIDSQYNIPYYFKKSNSGVVFFRSDDWEDELQDMIADGDLIPINQSVVAKPDPEDCVAFFQN